MSLLGTVYMNYPPLLLCKHQLHALNSIAHKFLTDSHVTGFHVGPAFFMQI